MPNSEDSQRVDKWLWAARFFKSRQLAIDAINGGKVRVDGQRCKPSRMLRPGSKVEIHKGSLSWEIEVLGLATQRRPATEAALLYAEDDASRLRRQQLVSEQRQQRSNQPRTSGRPTKRDRRRLDDFQLGD